jgi:hypothetical protein
MVAGIEGDMSGDGRTHAARDPEGNAWSFGTYRPVIGA